jgi:hypothetical protein
MPRRTLLAAALAAIAALVATAPARGASTFVTTHLNASDSDTEPRAAVAPDGTIHVVTNRNGSAAVYASTDGGTSFAVRGTFPNQTVPTIDVDVIALPEGRLVATELDLAGVNFRNAYSDDGGTTWHVSTGAATLADTDRQWLAYGPVNALTGKRTVYMLWHNLASGFGNHNMFVQTSVDGGETFLPPVPTTLPGSQAYADLQCADSSGPSGISVDQSTGRLYVLFGTRASSVAPLGGCGASVAPGPAAVNIVPPTRLWVATSPDNLPGSWTQSVAVDRSGTGQIVGTQLASLALDTAGNAYVAFTESASPTDYRSALKYVHAAPSLASWSAPTTVATLADSGNILPLVIAGDPGRLGFAWLHGKANGSGVTQWFSMVGQTIDGLAAAPAITTTQVSTVVAYTGSAATLMGSCSSGPLAGVENGFACDRSSDVYGIAAGAGGMLVVAWPTAANGTYVTTQQAGDSLYGP